MSELVKRLKEAAADERDMCLDPSCPMAELLEEAASALSRADYVMAPKEPTEEMLKAGAVQCSIPAGDLNISVTPEPHDVKRIYKAMLAAAQEKGQ